MAARLYWQARRMIEEWPEIAYQLLVYCVETVANRKSSYYSPSRAEMVAAKGGVEKRARKYGLTQQQAEDLAVLACSGMSWAFRKFQMFLHAAKENVTKDGDDLFRHPSVFDPPADELDEVISRIYKSRSAAAHLGEAYGASIALGTAPTVPISAVHELLSGSQEVPPIAWFERLVNAALCHYVDAEIASHARVRERAYQIFEERGKEHGHDLDDWLKAEAELSWLRAGRFDRDSGVVGSRRRRVSCGDAGFHGPGGGCSFLGLSGREAGGQGMARTRLKASANCCAQGQVSGIRRISMREWLTRRAAVCSSR